MGFEGAWSAKRVAKLLAWPAGIVVAVPLFGRFAGSCMGYEDVVMADLNACPRATELLGAPIGESVVGLSCGSAETSGDEGSASWRMPVAGPKGRGTYTFEVAKSAGRWTLQRGTLSAGGEEIDVGQCALAGEGQGLVAAQMLVGRVSSATGSPPVAPGAACQITLGPGGGPFGCRIVVVCGASTLYGATPTTGFTSCSVQPTSDGRRAITALDNGSTSPAGDPALDLHTATGEVILTERRTAIPWSITIRLDPAP